MPVFPAKVYCRDSALLGDQEFSFNFHVSEAGTSDQAWEDANEIAEGLVGTVFPPTIKIYEISIRNPDVVNGVQNRPVSLTGTRTVTGSPLPGWNVARIQGRAFSGSRLLTWWLRMGLTEDDVDGQQLTVATSSAVDDFISAVNLQGHFCDRTGNLITSFSSSPLVHMRQLGWHRRTRVGFHRGWVPNA